MPDLKIKEFPVSPPPSPPRQLRRSRLPLIAAEILATATISALTASKVLSKDHAIALLTICLSSQAADAAYQIKPKIYAKILGALGVVGAIGLFGDNSPRKAANAGLCVAAILEIIAPSEERLTWKLTAAVCADVFISYLVAGIGVGLVQTQMDPDALMTGMVGGYGICQILLR